MIEIGAVASEHTNLTTRSLEAQKSASNDFDVSMSFEDFIDMINPLQHIPVISSIYRAIAGEDINPVSRIAGDALYGGAFGLASAGLSAIGAIGDEMFAANNDGKSASETLVAALFDTGTDKNIQLAEASPPASVPAPAEVSTASLVQQAVSAKPEVPQTTLASAESKLMALASVDAPASKGLPLASQKLAFGGVMDSSLAAQNQSVAAAMAGRNDVLQAQRTLRNNRFSVATPAVPATPAAATEAIPTVKAEPETTAAMQKLLDELQAMKAINQYQNAAQNMPLAGDNVNIVN